MFLRRLFRQKCQEHDQYNPFNTDIDFQILPLRTKVDILHALCDFRLDADDVLDQLKNLEADSLRVEPLGFDGNDSAYWYFYGTRLYREDFTTKNNKKKSVWQVICFTEDDWFQLTKKFKKSSCKQERQLHHTLSENFLPELPRLFKEKESLARKRLLENLPRRTSGRLRKLECDSAEQVLQEKRQDEETRAEREKSEARVKKKKLEIKRQEAYERRSKLKRRSEEETLSESSVDYEMAGSKSKKNKVRQRKSSCSSTSSNDTSRKVSKREKKKPEDSKGSGTKSSTSKPTTVGRQTNNSLSAATGQILIQQVTNPNKKKLKTSQVFRQTDEDLQTGMHKILDYVKNSEDAWPFADPVEEEYAPNYYTVIRKPMDLQRMEERLDEGFYKNFSKFRADFQLIVDNCRLYNGAENEYTEMVGNLLQVFEKATDKYLDQISSSDDEIAIEFAKEESVKNTKTKHSEDVASTTSFSRRKPMLAAQTDRKRERSASEESGRSSRSNSYESFHDEVEIKSRRRKRSEVSESFDERHKSGKSKDEEPEVKKFKPDSTRDKAEAKKEVKKDKITKKEKADTKKEKADMKKEKVDTKKEKADTKKETPMTKEKQEKVELKKDKTDKKKKKHDAKKAKSNKKAAKENKSKAKKVNKKEKKKTQVRSVSPSPSRSRSPPPSDRSSPPPSWPPSSPDSRFDSMSKNYSDKRHSQDISSSEDSLGKDTHQKSSPFENYFQDFEDSLRRQEKKPRKDDVSLSPKPKDKHNKLRETIEKLKAKSEMKLQIGLEFELDPLKENKDRNKKPEKDDKIKSKAKDKTIQKAPRKERDDELDLDGNSTTDSIQSKKLAPKVPNAVNKNSSNMDALSIATEQTLKDINKWLDDTPKFSEFSSASNSPSYTGLDEFDSITSKPDQIPGKKLDKPLLPQAKKEGAQKDPKKRTFRDPSKFFKRREVQRTIDRLQPGKGKGNLISNVQNTGKVDEVFPLGPLSKLKDTKNSLIVKTDTNAPKLSLGSVLDSFGKHKFVDDQKKETEKEPVLEKKTEKPEVRKEEPEIDTSKAEEERKEKPVDNLPPTTEDAISGGGATPNLSAWFKAFGAPKMQPPAKKGDDSKPEAKGGEDNKLTESRKVPMPATSPSNDPPAMLQPLPRQRRISTGSSMSERSSFSQDMDSPRVGMDERGAYPAPYPSPLHRSPSGASPIMASPRPDISPKSAAYPTINGQMRVGFYQDTVSTKSSPDKSCSPRENPTQSPYAHYSEHVYAPNTTENAYYNYANSPYYTHAPNYSSTNPTPPYNTDAGPSYYDTSKPANYTANSPLSNAPSPANVQPGVYSQHSPTILPQNSPNVRSQMSPNVHAQMSPNVHAQMSPNVHAQMSPNVHSQMSPNVHSPMSPNVHSPMSTNVHSPMSTNVHSPMSTNVHSPMSPNVHSQISPNVHAQMSPNVHVQMSPNVHAQMSPSVQNSPSNLLIHSPSVPADSSPQVALPEPSPILIPSSPEMDAFQVEDRDKTMETVKKRAYADTELPQLSKQRFEIDPRLTQQLEQKRNHQANMEKKQESKPYVHQNIPDPKASAPVAPARESYPAVSNAFGSFGSESNFSLNIPTGRNQVKMDLSQYTNMGYTGPEVQYTRSLQQFSRSDLNYSSGSQKPTLTTPSDMQTGDLSMRYGDHLQQMSYKSTSNPQQARLNSANDNISERLTQSLSHMVDERLMAGLQNAGSFYTDKGLGSSAAHIFNKPISTSASALPIFSQSNMAAAMQSYGQNVQGTTTSMYNRQMTELQNAAVMQNDLKTGQQMQAQEKKSKKRKSSKNVGGSAPESQQQAAPNQGFQSYVGLKGTTSIEPSAISLKTSSVVPGSAFNFGPTPSGLGIGPGLYSDKDAYPNFLDEYRSAPNYYMAAAAAAHHRATPEASEKQTRPAHQSSNPQSTAAYPFLGAPQAARSSYPIGAPFIPNAQSQLMDTASPLYQHYLQAGVLNQSLLGPPGAYPPGYHAALSMRQPYDSMTRPPWI
nr:serine/arginine repetitive matrix protein 2-like isoform X2 [Leptinotarsa decemlineata]